MPQATRHSDLQNLQAPPPLSTSNSLWEQEEPQLRYTKQHIASSIGLPIPPRPRLLPPPLHSIRSAIRFPYARWRLVPQLIVTPRFASSPSWSDNACPALALALLQTRTYQIPQALRRQTAESSNMSSRQAALSLYRRSLKLSLDWAVHRHLWRGQALYIRSLFEANRNITDPRKQRALLSETEKLLETWKHPDPYCHPTAPGGSKYERNLPAHTTAAPPDLKF